MISVLPVLVRVRLNAVGTPPLTHMALLASLDDGDWLLDAGFGGGYCPPIRLAHGASADGPVGSNYLLSCDGQIGWTLERSQNGKVARQFSFDLNEVFPADIALSNHWTSTHPSSRFTRHLIVNRISNEGRVSLSDQKFDRTGLEESAVTIDSADQLAEILEREFALRVSCEEVAILARWIIR